MRLNLIKLMAIFMVMMLGACADLDLSNRVIRQGNLSAQSNLSRIKIGMSKEDVAAIMGSSVLTPIFRNNRWDYVNTRQAPRSNMVLASGSIYFKNGHVVKVQRNTR